MNSKEQLLKRVASQVRKKTERFADKEFFPSDLMGLCIDASIALRKILWRNGIRTQLTEGYFIDDKGLDRGTHYWLEWRGFIIDITATQFGLDKKVYICKTDPRYKRLEEQDRPSHRVTKISKMIMAI